MTWVWFLLVSYFMSWNLIILDLKHLKNYLMLTFRIILFKRLATKLKMKKERIHWSCNELVRRAGSRSRSLLLVTRAKLWLEAVPFTMPGLCCFLFLFFFLSKSKGLKGKVCWDSNWREITVLRSGGTCQITGSVRKSWVFSCFSISG